MTEKKSSWQNKMGKSHKMTKNNVVNDDNIDKNVEKDDFGDDIDKKILNNQVEDDDLDKKIQESEVKIVDLSNKLLRALAEIENLRRRHKDELEKTSSFAISGFVTDLVVVVENFFLTCDNLPDVHKETPPEIKNLIGAVEMTKRELMKVLEKNGVSRVAPLGEKFDHHIHEAVSHIESEHGKDEVIQVIQAGYILGQRIIKPSLVVVSKGPQ